MTNTATSRTLELIYAAQANLDRLTPQEAAAALDEGVLLIDTRTSEEQAADGIIPGAIRVPRNAVEVFLDPTHRPLFTPRRRPNCRPAATGRQDHRAVQSRTRFKPFRRLLAAHRAQRRHRRRRWLSGVEGGRTPSRRPGSLGARYWCVG